MPAGYGVAHSASAFLRYPEAPIYLQVLYPPLTIGAVSILLGAYMRKMRSDS